MDSLTDKPISSEFSTEPTNVVLSYTAGLSSGREYPPLLQIILVRTLEAQLSSNPFRAWLLTYPYQLIDACINATFLEADKFIRKRKAEILESRLYYRDDQIKLPEHGTYGVVVYD